MSRPSHHDVDPERWTLEQWRAHFKEVRLITTDETWTDYEVARLAVSVMSVRVPRRIRLDQAMARWYIRVFGAETYRRTGYLSGEGKRWPRFTHGGCMWMARWAGVRLDHYIDRQAYKKFGMKKP